MSIVEYHLRKIRLHRSRNISDICLFRLEGPVVLVVQEALLVHRHLVVHRGRAVLSDPVVLELRHFRVSLERPVVQVVLDHPVLQVRLALMVRFELVLRDRLQVQGVLLHQVDRAVLSDRVRLVVHRYRVVQVCPVRQDLRVIQVDLVGRVVLEGRVCMVVVLLVRMVLSVVDRDCLEHLERPVCLVFLVFREHLLDRGVLADSNHRIDLQY